MPDSIPEHCGCPTVILMGCSVRAAAVDARASGLKVIAVDEFGDLDLRAACDAWFPLAGICEDSSPLEAWPDAPIVPIGGFPHALLDRRLFDRRLIAYPTADSVTRLSDPLQLGALATQCGFDFPTTLRVIDRQPITLPTVGGESPQRWLFKPLIHGGGVGISEASKLSHAPSDGFLQRWHDGRPVGINFLARDPDHVDLMGAFGGLVHRHSDQQGHWYGGSYGPLRLPESCHDQLVRLGREAVKRFQLCGLFNVDLLLSRNHRATLLEINPRFSASMELLPQFGNLIAGNLAAYRRSRSGSLAEPSEGVEAARGCKRILYATRDTRFSEVRMRIDAIMEIDRRVHFCDLPSSDSIVPCGVPLMTVIVRDTPAVAIRQTARIARDLLN